MNKKYRVTLTAAERQELDGLLARGKADVRRLKHAQILLKADEAEAGPAWPDARIGTASLFLACEPLAGWRHVAVTEHRRRTDWALFIRALLEGRYCAAERVVLVMDQLNTHSPASLYEAFAPEEAKRLADRLEIHHTPKHGSWLNLVEVELSALARQCLSRRIARQDTLVRQIAQWQADRNAAQVVLVLTRLRGAYEAFPRGVSDAQNTPTLCAGVPAEMVELVRAGRDPTDLAREFEPSAQAIRNWVAQADRSEGRKEHKSDALTTAEREELVRLRRENKQLRLERDILSRAAAWFARETGAVPSGSSNS